MASLGAGPQRTADIADRLSVKISTLGPNGLSLGIFGARGWSAGVPAGWLGCVSLPNRQTLEFRW